MNKEETRKAIIEMGNGNPDNPESWIELKVKDLDYALNKFVILGLNEGADE